MKTGLRTTHRPIKTGLYQSGPVKGIFGPVLDRSRSRLSPIWVEKPDWTGLLNTNKQGAMCYATILQMGMSVDPKHWETIKVAITNIGQNKILLGTDWLRAHNPSIDWGAKTIKFDCCPPHCHPSDVEALDRRT